MKYRACDIVLYDTFHSLLIDTSVACNTLESIIDQVYAEPTLEAANRILSDYVVDGKFTINLPLKIKGVNDMIAKSYPDSPHLCIAAFTKGRITRAGKPYVANTFYYVLDSDMESYPVVRVGVCEEIVFGFHDSTLEKFNEFYFYIQNMLVDRNLIRGYSRPLDEIDPQFIDKIEYGKSNAKPDGQRANARKKNMQVSQVDGD